LNVSLVKTKKKRYRTHYFRRSLKRATASTDPSTSAIANGATLGSTLPLMLKPATASSLRALQAAIRSGQSAGKQGALFRLIRIGYKTGENPTPH
jgi:hypothetical protein